MVLVYIDWLGLKLGLGLGLRLGLGVTLELEFVIKRVFSLK